jgi:hypothetical protein
MPSSSFSYDFTLIFLPTFIGSTFFTRVQRGIAHKKITCILQIIVFWDAVSRCVVNNLISRMNLEYYLLPVCDSV